VTDTPKHRFSPAWTLAGYVFFLPVLLLGLRILYEETILTWKSGPQMVGFALMHIHPGLAILGMLGFVLGAFWVMASLVLILWRRRRPGLVAFVPLIGISALSLLASVPYDMWEVVDVDLAGPGDSGVRFLADAAATGHEKAVGHLLGLGLDINSEDSGGRCVLSAAAVGGNVRMIQFALAHGAQINRHDHLAGETALMAAAEMGRANAVDYLLAKGAGACLLDNEGHTAEGLARKYHHEGIAGSLGSRFQCKENLPVDVCANGANPPGAACVRL
jgi:hypothetical protein